jgi:hypothetical protein
MIPYFICDRCQARIKPGLEHVFHIDIGDIQYDFCDECADDEYIDYLKASAPRERGE